MNKVFSYIWSKFLILFKFADYKTLSIVTRSASFSIPPKTVVLIGPPNMPKWAMLQCPCGCKETLTLSLMRKHAPSWEIKRDRWQRISLSPSVWKNDGCKSHFFIKKGKITWCDFDRQ